MDRTSKLIDTIGKLMQGGFSGHIKINFTQGSIGRVEKSEELGDADIATETEKTDTTNKGGAR